MPDAEKIPHSPESLPAGSDPSAAVTRHATWGRMILRGRSLLETLRPEAEAAPAAAPAADLPREYAAARLDAADGMPAAAAAAGAADADADARGADARGADARGADARGADGGAAADDSAWSSSFALDPDLPTGKYGKGRRPSERAIANLAATLDPQAEDAYDQLWIKAQRRLSGQDEQEEDDELDIRHQSIQSMVVTSWAAGEGASSAALGIALRAAANTGGRILLVDADFQNAGLSRVAQLHHRPGLSDLMAQTADLDDVLIAVPGTDLTFLPAGTEAGHDALASDAVLMGTVGLLEEHFRYVFYDTSCLKKGVEAYRWGRFVRNAILVIRAMKSRRQTVDHAVASMRLQGMELLGTVLNRRVDPIPGWLYPYL